MEPNTAHAKIVTGQRVTEGKVLCARQMRREMTPSEILLWERLRRDALGVRFRRQQVIGGFIADFYCHPAALVVEVDGSVHDPEYDAERDRILSGHGVQVLRVSNAAVERDMDGVLRRIAEALGTAPRHGANPSLALP